MDVSTKASKRRIQGTGNAYNGTGSLQALSAANLKLKDDLLVAPEFVFSWGARAALSTLSSINHIILTDRAAVTSVLPIRWPTTDSRSLGSQANISTPQGSSFNYRTAL